MNSPAEQIRREIRENGPVTLARFMELALFSPDFGYYEQQRDIGRHGDFYTSVSVGSVYGELLAFQIAEWIKDFSRPMIVEPGAHDGRLAADILGWMGRFQPGLFARLAYVLIEPSEGRRAWQRETLEAWEGKVRWVSDLEELLERGVQGVIVSNEFLDAAPAHRLGWDAATRAWREWRIDSDGVKFNWTLGALSPETAGLLLEIPPELAVVLPDRFTVEISPWAAAWWRKAAERLGAGKLVTVDYGFITDEWLRPQNQSGTLRGYVKHRVTDDPLADPGLQDLTAHVNFSALQAAGEADGLRTEGLVSQANFLTRIFAQTQAAPAEFGEWTSERVRQFQTLTHPEHLGRPFRVLTQSRSTETSGPRPKY